MNYILQMTMDIDSELDEESLVEDIKNQIVDMQMDKRVKLTLIREGDRSAKNLLRDRIEGRFGNHLSSKKITAEELLGNKDKL